jgi:hypothetical protein
MKPKRNVVVAREPVKNELDVILLEFRYLYVADKFKSFGFLTAVSHNLCSCIHFCNKYIIIGVSLTTGV